MKWTEKYATGISEIDSQHKTLFGSTEEFRESLASNCSPETYLGFLEFLQLYAGIHFSLEGECMLARHCPAASQNQKEHKSFMALIDDALRDYHDNGFDRPRAKELLDRVDAWLDTHILRVDTQLRKTEAA